MYVQVLIYSDYGRMSIHGRSTDVSVLSSAYTHEAHSALTYLGCGWCDLLHVSDAAVFMPDEATPQH